MNPYQHLVEEYARFAQQGKSYPLGGFDPLPRPQLAPDAPKALIFSPHPDDECIIGGVAMRMLREAGMRVVNVAVTQGSKKDRQAGRWAELVNACDYLGFDLIPTQPNGLEKVNPKTRTADPSTWSAMVGIIARILQTHRPKAILFPHELDWNSTHIGTHFLVADALRTLPADFETYAFETEFWGPMADPNLMVESSPKDVGDMITALSFHVEEVRRNPYHILTPAWMQDNVRRGGELVGGQGGAAPNFTFATLYRLRKWSNGEFSPLYAGGRNLPLGTSPATLFAS